MLFLGNFVKTYLVLAHLINVNLITMNWLFTGWFLTIAELSTTWLLFKLKDNFKSSCLTFILQMNFLLNDFYPSWTPYLMTFILAKHSTG